MGRSPDFLAASLGISLVLRRADLRKELYRLTPPAADRLAGLSEQGDPLGVERGHGAAGRVRKVTAVSRALYAVEGAGNLREAASLLARAVWAARG